MWDDLDGDGIQDVGEPGLDGVTVTLTGTDGAGNAVSLTTVTVAGIYSFDVAPGVYEVVVDVAGYDVSAADRGGDDALDSDVDGTGAAPAVTVVSGQTDNSIDAGLSSPTAISGVVWFDADADGVRGAGEAPAAGVQVELLDGLGAVIATTTTAGDGTMRSPG